MGRFLTNSGYSVVSRLLGLVLLAAGLLKGYELATAFVPGTSAWDSLWFQGGVAGFESLLGLWLLVAGGLYRNIIWWVTTACFVVFFGVSLDRGLASEPSCGCFGKIPVNPWHAFAIDGAAIMALLLVQPAGSKTFPSRWMRVRLAGFGLSAVAIGISFAIVVSSSNVGGQSSVLDSADDASVIALPPENWLGKHCPLLGHIDVGDRLQHGHWRLMLFHQDCTLCRQAVPQYVGMVHAAAGRAGSPNFALIEVPPYQGASPETGAAGTVYLRGRLSEAKRWAGRTPFYLELKEGVVTAATESPDALLGDAASSASPSGNGVAAATLPDYPHFRRQLFLNEIACGPLSLLAVMQDLQFNLSPTEIDTLLAAAGSHGTDMLQLKELAEERGLHALGVAVSTQQLKRTGLHAVVHLNGVGFASVLGYTADGVRVVYPVRPPGILPDDIFERAFGETGNALLLSRSPLSAERLGIAPSAKPEKAGPVLRLARSMLSVGRVYSHDWEEALTLFNDGTEDLLIHEVRPSCSLLTAAADRARVPPQQSTTLRAKGRQPVVGAFTHTVLLSTNEPGKAAQVILPVRGYVEQPLGFEKPVVMLRGLLPGHPAHTEVPFDLPPGIDPSQLQADVPGDTPLQAAVVQGADGLRSLAIDWRGSDAVGLQRYQIGIRVSDSDRDVVSYLHYAVEVVPEVEVFPASLSVHGSEIAAKTWTRRVTVKSLRPINENCAITWSDPRLAAAFTVVLSRQDATSLSLEFSFNQEMPSRIPSDKAEALLHLPEGETHKIRILFLE